MSLSEEDALRIAREDAQGVYQDLSMYSVSVEAQDNTWLVAYRPSDPFTVGGGPQYVISRETGKVLSKHYEQ